MRGQRVDEHIEFSSCIERRPFAEVVERHHLTKRGAKPSGEPIGRLVFASNLIACGPKVLGEPVVQSNGGIDQHIAYAFLDKGGGW